MRTFVRKRVVSRPRRSASDAAQADRAAMCIERSFNSYNRRFTQITRRAKVRFERRDWKGRHRDAIERLDAYERTLTHLARQLSPILGRSIRDRTIWIQIKRCFNRHSKKRRDLELAESFFNSATRKILQTVGVDREVEFFHLVSPPRRRSNGVSVFRTYTDGSVFEIIRQILNDHRLAVPFEDIDRDAERIAREIELHLWPIIGFDNVKGIDVVLAPFYRNKVAYLIGRVRADKQTMPLCVPLYNGPAGIYADAVLLTESEVSRVFSFAFSYFHVLIDRHDALLDFLKSILPEKPVAELYTSLGYTKHGKTEFYRDLHKRVHESRDKFMIAPGKEGAVMIAFTLPGYGFVFKLIKDRPGFLRSADPTAKRTTRAEVMAKYAWVCHSDRVGRMVDTQEFENLRFRLKRFSRSLLREFQLAARDTVALDGEHLVISHLYVQRRVIPLPMYLSGETDPEQIRSVIIDFGWFLKDLAASGIFPSDLFNIWNYGVTRRGRVVLFDYDDVQTLEQTRFMQKPAPRNQAEEFQPEEDRIASMPDDFFMDEIERYSGLPHRLKGVFKAIHGDLFTIDYWLNMQARVKHGEIFDIIPYDHRRRFRRQPVMPGS